MVLQSSGAISLANLQTEFGGANPIGLNEYYTSGYASGVTGIPTSGQISLNQFYGKAKPTSGGTWPTTAAQQTDYNSYGLPWGVGSTSLEWLTGASGTNLTRSGGSTFNTLGWLGQYRGNFANYQDKILQAKPGDTIRFVIQNGASSGYDYEVNSVLLNLGGGYFSIGSVGGNGGHTDTIDYTISAGQALGNFAITVYNNYSSAGSSTWASANFYSLHICN